MFFTKSKYFLIVVLLILAILCGLLAWWVGRPLASVNNDSSLQNNSAKLKETLDESLPATNQDTIYKDFEQNLINDNNSSKSFNNQEVELFTVKKLDDGYTIYSVSHDFVDREPFAKAITNPAINTDKTLLTQIDYLFSGNGQKLQLISSDAQFYGEFRYNQEVYWFFGVNKVTGTKDFYVAKQNLKGIKKLNIYNQDIVGEVIQDQNQGEIFEINIYDGNGKGAKLSKQNLDLKTLLE